MKKTPVNEIAEDFRRESSTGEEVGVGWYKEV